MYFHHIGYLVKDITESMKAFILLGYEIENDIQLDNIRKAKISFLIKDSNRIELIQPIGVESPIYGLLKHYKNSPYHLCFVTDSLSKEVEGLENKGFMLFKNMEIAPCLNNKNVVFLMHPNMGIIELCES